VIPGLAVGGAGLAGGAGQRVMLGLVVQVGEPGLPESLRSGGLHLVVSSGAELSLVSRMPPGPGGADRAVAQYLGRQSV
jgi:hypothetical protein